MKRIRIVIAVMSLVVLVLACFGFRRTTIDSRSPDAMITVCRSFGRIVTVKFDGDRDGRADEVIRYDWHRAPWSIRQMVGMSGTLLVKPDEVWTREEVPEGTTGLPTPESTSSARAEPNGDS